MKRIFQNIINSLKREFIKEIKKETKHSYKKQNNKGRKHYKSQNQQRQQSNSQDMKFVDAFNEIEEVKLTHLIDGDTARFKFSNNREYKARFLFVDTPENTKTVEKYGKEATDFVRRQFANADKVEVEFDKKRYDHYDRLLVWVWISKDNKRQLLQELLAANGYVEKFYDYGTYKYESRVRKSLNDKYNIFEQKNYDRHSKKNY